MSQGNLPVGSLVLGVDPGLNITGYGVVEVTAGAPKLCEAGVVRTKSGASLQTRILEVFEGISEVLAAHRPTAMALEKLYTHYKRPTTAILMGHARGVICLASAQADVPVFDYAATRVKKLATGNGHAPKTQIQTAMQREFGLPNPPEPADVADALAIALCHLHMVNSAVPT